MCACLAFDVSKPAACGGTEDHEGGEDAGGRDEEFVELCTGCESGYFDLCLPFLLTDVFHREGYQRFPQSCHSAINVWLTTSAAFPRPITSIDQIVKVPCIGPKIKGMVQFWNCSLSCTPTPSAFSRWKITSIRGTSLLHVSPTGLFLRTE